MQKISKGIHSPALGSAISFYRLEPASSLYSQQDLSLFLTCVEFIFIFIFFFFWHVSTLMFFVCLNPLGFFVCFIPLHISQWLLPSCYSSYVSFWHKSWKMLSCLSQSSVTLPILFLFFISLVTVWSHLYVYLGTDWLL